MEMIHQKILHMNNIKNKTKIIVYNYYIKKENKGEYIILDTNNGLLYSNYYLSKIIKNNPDIKIKMNNIPYIFNFTKLMNIYNNKTKISIIDDICFHKYLNIKYKIYILKVFVFSFFKDNNDKYMINTNYGIFNCNKYLKELLKNNISKFDLNDIYYIKYDIPYIFNFDIVKNNKNNKININKFFNIQFHKLLKININIQNI